jgi:hypothetical protein
MKIVAMLARTPSARPYYIIIIIIIIINIITIIFIVVIRVNFLTYRKRSSTTLTPM